MTKRESNYEKIYKILITYPDDLFNVKELAVMSSLSERQVHRALQTLKERKLAIAYIDQYSGFGKRRSYYGLTELLYKQVTMGKRT